MNHHTERGESPLFRRIKSPELTKSCDLNHQIDVDPKRRSLLPAPKLGTNMAWRLGLHLGSLPTPQSRISGAQIFALRGTR